MEIITAIIAVTALIVFFVMADKIGKIQKDVNRMVKYIAPDKLEHDYLAQREKYKGNKEHALDHYRNLMFQIEPYLLQNRPAPYWKNLSEKTKEKIKNLESK